MNIHLIRCLDGACIHTYTPSAEAQQEIVTEIVAWLRIEVFPYWESGELTLQYDTENEYLSGALFTCACLLMSNSSLS